MAHELVLAHAAASAPSAPSAASSSRDLDPGGRLHQIRAFTSSLTSTSTYSVPALLSGSSARSPASAASSPIQPGFGASSIRRISDHQIRWDPELVLADPVGSGAPPSPTLAVQRAIDLLSTQPGAASPAAASPGRELLSSARPHPLDLSSLALLFGSSLEFLVLKLGVAGAPRPRWTTFYRRRWLIFTKINTAGSSTPDFGILPICRRSSALSRWLRRRRWPSPSPASVEAGHLAGFVVAAPSSSPSSCSVALLASRC